MPYCASCGQDVEMGDCYCSSCGASINPLPYSQKNPEEKSDEIRWSNSVLGISTEFYVTENGAGQSSSSATSTLNTGIAIAGALLGSLTAAGGGLLAKSRESDYIAWEDTRTISLNNAKKTITITRKSMLFPIRLYCTDDNYELVVGFLRRYVNPGIIRE